MRALNLLREGEGALKGSPDAKWDAREALLHVMDIAPTALGRHLEDEIGPASAQQYRALIERRAAGEPLQYVLGRAWFMGLEILTDARALIPRQDTELLCEEALRWARERGISRALDLCTGSGALAVALAKLGGLKMAAADISREALALAQENARRQGLDVAFYEGDLFTALPAGERFPMIVCNPPYLTDEDMRALQREVACEPALALWGGPDGLQFYRRLDREAGEALEPGGCLMMEIGSGQGEQVRAIFSGWRTRVLQDLNGLDRLVIAEEKTTQGE